MSIRLPVHCTKPSEPEATSTRRKSASKALSDCAAPAAAADCARSSLASQKKMAHKTLSDTTKAAIVREFQKPRTLFISPSWMLYMCADSNIDFRRVEESILNQGDKNESYKAGENSTALHPCSCDPRNHGCRGAASEWSGAESRESISHPRTSVQRRDSRGQYSIHRRTGRHGRFQ